MVQARSSQQMLYTAAQCRELDRVAVEDHGMPGFDLMQRAGRAAFRVLTQHWPEAASITVCCGKGNNAGDGYLVAGLAQQAGLRVTLVQLGDPAALRGDAARARDWAASLGVDAQAGPPENIEGAVVVDALLGTGIEGELRPPFAETAARINDSGRPVLAIDVPTGVSADTGAVTEHAVRAAVTVTFIGRKLGLYTGPAVSHAGAVVFDDLGVPGAVYRAVPGGCPRLHYDTLTDAYRLPARDANVHKHALGHLVVVGGDHSMGGAPLMAAEAALRCGAGMVSVITRACHRPAILARRPEVMVVDADDAALRGAVLDKATTLVLGPGLGQAPWGQGLFEETLERGLPTVLDADGLNLFASLRAAARGPLVATPHPGEAGRLLGSNGAEIQADRPAAARALAERLSAAVVLKGAGSLVAAPGTDGRAELLGLCAHGNPGMASAGMGDVLSGVIGALLAQGLGAGAAAAAGTCLHSYAGDRAADVLGQRGLLATDLLEHLLDIVRRQAPLRRPEAPAAQ